MTRQAFPSFFLKDVNKAQIIEIKSQENQLRSELRSADAACHDATNASTERHIITVPPCHQKPPRNEPTPPVAFETERFFTPTCLGYLPALYLALQQLLLVLCYLAFQSISYHEVFKLLSLLILLLLQDPKPGQLYSKLKPKNLYQPAKSERFGQRLKK